MTRATSGTTYRSAAPDVATVGEDGEVQGRAPGRTVVRVELAGLVAEVPVLVDAEGAFVGLVLEPNTVALQPGALRRLRALALTPSRERVDVTGNGTRFSSSAPQVATVDASGLVSGRARGRAEVEVLFRGLRATAEIAVAREGPFSLRFAPPSLDVQVGDVVPYKLIQVFTDGVTEDLTLDPSVVYRASPDAPFTVANGRLSALRVGEGTLEARVGDVTARLSVVVRAPVVALRIEPDVIAVELDGRATFRVWALRDDGASVDVTEDPRLWVTLEDRVLASIERPGTVFGRFEGTTAVLARFGGVMGRATLVVTPNREPILVITAPRQVPFSTPARYRVQRVEPGLSPIDVTADPRLVMRADPPPALLFPEPGVFEARRSGVAKLRASLDGLEAEVEILVDPPPRARSLEFVPPSLALASEQTVGVSLIATLADGTRLDVTYEPSVTFLARGSVSTAIETVSGLFSVRSRAAGSGTVTATYDGMTTVLVVTVTSTLIGIEVDPPSVRVEVGRTQALNVTGLYDDGTRSQLLGVGFAVADPTRARLSAFGAVTGVAAGSTTVRVTSGPLIVDVPVEVIPPLPVATTLQPDLIAAGSGDTVVELVGQNFLPGDVVRVEGVRAPTRFVSDQRLTFTVSAAALAQATILSVDVTSARGDSRAVALNVGVAPRVTSASPNTLLVVANPVTFPVTVTGLGLLGVVPSAPGLSFVADGVASNGRWARWIVTVAGGGSPGPRAVTLSSVLGSTTFTLDVVDVGSLRDLTVRTGQTLTLSGTQPVSNLRVEQGARVIAAGPEPLVFIAAYDITIAGEIIADGAAAGFAGGDAGGAGAGGGAGGTMGVGSSGAGGRGAPMGQSALATGFGGAGGGEGGGFGATVGCAGGGGGGFGGRGGDGGQAPLSSGGWAGGLGSDRRGGTGGGGGALCGGPTTMRGGSGGGGGGAGVIVLIAPFGTVLVEATGAVSADGGAGGDVPSGSALVGCGGGGGSGGRVELVGLLVNVWGVARARGGRGGHGQGAGDGGGGGGGGNILIQTRAPGQVSAAQLDVSGGAAGRGGLGLGSATGGGRGVSVVR